MDRVKRVKKYTYLLLELLVALFLLSLFLAPLLNAPFAHVRKQMKEMTTLYLQLEEEKLLASIEEQLRTGEIPWDTVASSSSGSVPVKTHLFKIPKDTHQYEAKLALTRASLQNEGDLTFGTVKATVKIYQVPQKKLKKTPVSLSLFVLKKQTVDAHGPG